MTHTTGTSLAFALDAANAAAPDLAGDRLDTAVTAVVNALAGQTRSMQAALRASAESVSAEREILTGAQLWVLDNDDDDIAGLKEILGGHSTYGFEPTGMTTLDPASMAEAATEAYLREFARAEQLQRELDAARA